MNKAVIALRMKSAALKGDTETPAWMQEWELEPHRVSETVVTNHWNWRKGLDSICDCAYCAWLANETPLWMGLVIDRA